MPNLVKFREDPDAMLVMSLEDYDEVTGKAARAAIMTKDVVGKKRPLPGSAAPSKGCWSPSTRRAPSICPSSPASTAGPRNRSSASLATSSSATRKATSGKRPTPSREHDLQVPDGADKQINADEKLSPRLSFQERLAKERERKDTEPDLP
jgi:hypothetical protein